jgi:hypothetical protein
MRYAPSARNPTGGKVERIPRGAGCAAPIERTTSLLPTSKSVELEVRPG